MARNEKYAVVKFLSDGMYNEIPAAWLITEDDNQQCWWPPRTANSKLLISNCALPNYNTWTKHDVNIIKYCTSLESAYKSAADITCCNDEERLGRGHRQRFHPYNRFEEEYDYYPSRKHNSTKKHSNTTTVSTLPSCSYNGSNNTKDVLQINDKNECNITTYYYENENKPTVRRSEDQFSTSNELPIIIEGYTSLSQNEENLNVKQNTEQILRMLDTTNALLKNLMQRITKLEHVVNNRASSYHASHLPKNNSMSFIAKFLPLKTINDIKDFDLILKTTDEAVTQFKEFVSKIGGNNPRHTVQRTMNKIFTNRCAMKCSLKGRKNNFPVKDLYSIKITREIILQHVDLTELDFDNIVAEWLRFAKQRRLRENKGKQNEDDEEDEEKNYE